MDTPSLHASSTSSVSSSEPTISLLGSSQTSSAEIQQLVKCLKARLSYAHYKVDKGCARQKLAVLENRQNGVADPATSNDTKQKRKFDAIEASDYPQGFEYPDFAYSHAVNFPAQSETHTNLTTPVTTHDAFQPDNTTHSTFPLDFRLPAADQPAAHAGIPSSGPRIAVQGGRLGSPLDSPLGQQQRLHDRLAAPVQHRPKRTLSKSSGTTIAKGSPYSAPQFAPEAAHPQTPDDAFSSHNLPWQGSPYNTVAGQHQYLPHAGQPTSAMSPAAGWPRPNTANPVDHIQGGTIPMRPPMMASQSDGSVDLYRQHQEQHLMGARLAPNRMPLRSHLTMHPLEPVQEASQFYFDPLQPHTPQSHSAVSSHSYPEQAHFQSPDLGSRTSFTDNLAYHPNVSNHQQQHFADLYAAHGRQSDQSFYPTMTFEQMHSSDHGHRRPATTAGTLSAGQAELSPLTNDHVTNMTAQYSL